MIVTSLESFIVGKLLVLMANTSCYIVEYSVDYDKGADFLVNTFNNYFTEILQCEVIHAYVILLFQPKVKYVLCLVFLV